MAEHIPKRVRHSANELFCNARVFIEQGRYSIKAVEEVMRTDLTFQGLELQLELPAVGPKLFSLCHGIVPVGVEETIKYLVDKNRNGEKD